jgi:hypothetical protein
VSRAEETRSVVKKHFGARPPHGATSNSKEDRRNICQGMDEESAEVNTKLSRFHFVKMMTSKTVVSLRKKERVGIDDTNGENTQRTVL